MSARFVTNLVVLLAGAGLVAVCFAYSGDTATWVSLGVGATAILAALANFALPRQGVYQRIADAAIVAVGAWAIVAAQVLADYDVWRVFSAGAALAGLGALGLVVHELERNRRLQVLDTWVRADHPAELSAARS